MRTVKYLHVLPFLTSVTYPLKRQISINLVKKILYYYCVSCILICTHMLSEIKASGFTGETPRAFLRETFAGEIPLDCFPKIS